ncbi:MULTISPECIES: ATP-binding protein [Nocardia]|uniref:ATP-binding protein n=1 Tax=Nocardia TaxID=1817 RepID=UPI0005C1EB28|nr:MULTISPECIES: ATP-binding protein [Nocardia]
MTGLVGDDQHALFTGKDASTVADGGAQEPPVSGEALLDTRIADRAKVTAEQVRDVFATYGWPLVFTPARPRSLRLVRLRLEGVRAGKVAPGAFDTTFDFTTGLTALVASNFRGKTSVLELITWCLRGTPRRELQSGVRGWLNHLDLDITVAGQSMGFRLDITDGAISSATVLTAPSASVLAHAREPDPAQKVTVLLQATGEQSYAEQVANLMLDRLDLSQIVSTLNETSTQTHGWPAYFAAMYLGSASTKILLGDHPMSGLAGRLLQVFLDLPAAAALTRVRTARDVRRNEAQARQAEWEREAAQRLEERTRIEAELVTARARLAELTAAAGHSGSLTELARKAAHLAGQVADARAVDDDARRAEQSTKTDRQRAAKRLADVRESKVARALFQGLDPDACPRCDQAITTDRRHREHHSHACAVCDRPVDTDDAEAMEIIAEAEVRLNAAAEAEDQVRAHAESTRTRLRALTAELATADELLRSARSATALPEVMQAQQAVWRLEGALEVLPASSPPGGDEADNETVTLRVLDTAVKILDADNKNAADALFNDLGREVVDLSRRFGMLSLENVRIDRGARMKVTKDGGGEDWFSDCDSGARLRLRIALVIALLRVGAAYGVSTHPGLVMIDSPKAEEVQDLDATVLFRELAAVAEEQGIQVVITTRDYDLVHTVLDAKHTIEADENEPLW